MATEVNFEIQPPEGRYKPLELSVVEHANGERLSRTRSNAIATKGMAHDVDADGGCSLYCFREDRLRIIYQRYLCIVQ